jgi:Flp pilus assembly protein TadG
VTGRATAPAPGRRAGLDWRDDRGQVGGIEVLPFGLLIFVVGSLLIANAWGVVDAKLAVTSAAREAVRAYVEAPDSGAAQAEAQAAARTAIDGHGRNGTRARIEFQHLDDRPYARCTRAVVTVSYPVPAIALPFIGGYGDAFEVSARQSEIVDPYRSGLPGEATC